MTRDEDGRIKYQDLRCRALPFGLICCPMIATFIMREHTKRYSDNPQLKNACAIISEDSYVDDVIINGETEENLATEVKNVVHILNEADLPTHKYISNSPSALEDFPPDKLSSKTTVSVLGTMWNSLNDKLTLKLISPEKIKNSNHHLTKRSLLALLASVFDVCGYIAPFTLLGKHLLQECWSRKIPWDVTLPEDIATPFKVFTDELPQLEALCLPRRFFQSDDAKITEICSFADASQHAFAAVVYIVSTNADGSKNSHLAFAKTRVRPLSRKLKRLTDEMSICRMELLAALLCARITKFVGQALKHHENLVYRHFSDSMVTLHRLANENPEAFKPFIANRLKAIASLTNLDNWHYISTDENFAADSASRGLTLSEFKDDSRWWNGPACITLEISTWRK